MDFFTFFSLPRRLHLDTTALERTFYALSRKLHPDRFASKSVGEQEAALAQSSLLNDAYRTLKDPILRTQYLLSLEGVEFEEQSKAATEAARSSGTQKKQIVPPELLEEVFELNMQLQEMRAARAMGDSEEEPELRRGLLAAKDTFDAKMVETQGELETLWSAWDAALESDVAGKSDAAGDGAGKAKVLETDALTTAAPTTANGETATREAATRELLKGEMVNLLNKRSYLRNLVRDVNQALE